MIKRTTIIGAILSILGAMLASPNVEAATLLPPGKNCFYDANGAPVAAGTVNFYIPPATTTPKNTWQNAAASVLNTNPVLLDSAGCAIIYGDGVYRQIVKDHLGNLIWDQLTASTGGQTGTILYGGVSTGSANAQVITVSGFTATDGQLVSFIAGFTNTNAVTIDAGTGGISVRYDSSSGPVVLTGNEIHVSNVVVALYTSGFFHLIGPPLPIQYQTTTNYQPFTANGTWTKPPWVLTDPSALIFAQCWGGGGGGGANATGGGGGGGGYGAMTYLASFIPFTVAVTIGAGGAISGVGGNSAFSFITGFGGGAGQDAAAGGGGGGGGPLAIGSAGAAGAGGTGAAPGGAGGGAAAGSNPGAYGDQGGGGGGGNAGGNGGVGGGSLFGGSGGGGGASGTGGNGGDTLYGGAGGGGGAGGLHGTSRFAGNGGDSGVAGATPAGGGGRGATGARGECRIWITP